MSVKHVGLASLPTPIWHPNDGPVLDLLRSLPAGGGITQHADWVCRGSPFGVEVVPFSTLSNQRSLKIVGQKIVF